MNDRKKEMRESKEMRKIRAGKSSFEGGDLMNQLGEVLCELLHGFGLPVDLFIVVLVGDYEGVA